jgi:DNA polymerase-1
MIIQADIKGLEVVVAAYLSQDEVLCKEIVNGVDIHEENRKRFGFPTRLIAKTFKFRLIYGGSAWAYALDPEFNFISKKPEYWQGIIDEYYKKYAGLQCWHRYLMHEATSTGKVVCPTGRYFSFKQYQKKGEWVWPRTTILNYPVQGTGADLVSLARVEFFKRFKGEKLNGYLVSSVHDSLLVDVPGEVAGRTAELLFESVEAIPRLFEERFGVAFNLPVTAEVSRGPNHKDLKEVHRNN